MIGEKKETEQTASNPVVSNEKTDASNAEKNQKNLDQIKAKTESKTSESVAKSEVEGKSSEEPVNEDMSAHWRQQWLKLGDFTLTLFDKYVIETPIEWLTDTHINASQHLLSVQFLNIKGLQNVLLNEIQEFVAIKKGQTFVQIINDGGRHWLVLSNAMANKKETICKVYDSNALNSQSYDKEVKNAIQQLMSADNIEVEVEFVSQQPDLNQCGLYAIAFAQALCSGEDPSTILFSNNAELMRQHLMSCLEESKISPFPTGTDTVVDSLVI